MSKNKKKVLIADDEVTITTHLEKRLTLMGYEVVGRASSGEEAINMARRLRPDLILMDIVMPGKHDGIYASEKIKAELDIPVIFLTAHGGKNFVNRARYVEQFGYIVKPFQENEIRAAIEVALYRKDMERQLRRSEEKYRSVVDTARDAIITVDGLGNIVAWNCAAETIFGCSANKAIGKTLDFIIPERFRKSYKKGFKQAVSKGRPEIMGKMAEMTGLRKDGSEFPVEFSLARWKTGEGIFFTAIIRDITERKRMEGEIETSRTSFHNIVERSADGIIITDKDGNVRFIDSTAELIFGRKGKEFVGELFGFPVITSKSTEVDIISLGRNPGIGEMRVVET